jgi:hypothetical protein
VGVEATKHSGRPDGNNETRLEEIRESVACAGCADAEVEAVARTWEATWSSSWGGDIWGRGAPAQTRGLSANEGCGACVDNGGGGGVDRRGVGARTGYAGMSMGSSCRLAKR